MKRKALSKKVRFEVFKRDSFTCQYCGRAAPDVILHIDHINPVSKGGDNGIINLLTSCQECNSGKGNRQLDDHSVLGRQREQLRELNERRAQMELMIQWQRGLITMKDEAVQHIVDVLNERAVDVEINQQGKDTVRKWLSKFSLPELLEAADISFTQYGDQGAIKVFEMIPSIAFRRRLSKDDPDLAELYYIRGICRNRFSYCNGVHAMKLLKEARSAGIELGLLKIIALSSRTWTDWNRAMQDVLGNGE